MKRRLSSAKELTDIVDSMVLNKPNVSAGTNAGNEMAALTDNALLDNPPAADRKMQTPDELMQFLRDFDIDKAAKESHPNEPARAKVERSYNRYKSTLPQVEVGPVAEPVPVAGVQIGDIQTSLDPKVEVGPVQVAAAAPQAPAPARETPEQQRARLKAEDQPVEPSMFSPLDLIGPGGAAVGTERAVLNAAENKFANMAASRFADGPAARAAEKFIAPEAAPMVAAAKQTPEWLAEHAEGMKRLVANADTTIGSGGTERFADNMSTHMAELRESLYRKALDAAQKEGTLDDFFNNIVTNVVNAGQRAKNSVTRAGN